MKIIDFKEIKKIAEKMKPAEWYDWVDNVLRKKDLFDMPPKIHMSQENGNYYNIMLAMYSDENLVTLKMIGRHSLKENEKRSVMMGDIMLYEADTGILKAVMDAEYITTLRTGVVAAHSAIEFAKKDFDTLGLIGLGNIMTVFFITFIDKLRDGNDNRKLTVKLYRHNQQEVRFAERFNNLENIEFIYCESYEEVIRNTDIVVSAVTKVDKNFVSDDCFKQGVTVIPICTMGFQNCDLFFDKVFTDEIEQIRGFKYFDKFKSVANVSDVLNMKKKGRESDRERIIVYNYGLGIHDLYFANKFYSLADVKDVSYNYPNSKYFV
ncbi:hypothetical protein SY111_17970 [Ligilactobacillus agilis]|uniref:Ornithine cyclodeaminase n=1 Tax=Ligilactobacillus agilis TaxID=1601 RepID=A0A6F9XV69_9LACO|nr:ornithine cyclodeaminase [Ligilactobacillus agilis]GET09173.1 hypothetical protein SY111_17970 [Ligilactobacillus agilis]